MNLVTLENIRKQYSERVLLEDASLLVNRGDRLGLIGVNGSGKTTLLRIMAGLEAPDEGRVTIWGGVRIQFLAQEPILDEASTVLDQLFQSDAPQMRLLRDYEAASLALNEHPDDPEVHERFLAVSTEMSRRDGWKAEADAKAILSRLGIEDFEAPVPTLSGGQRKRVALARALLDPGDLLILDEPTNHVDADTIDWLEGHLLALDCALVMVTHDRYFLDRIVTRILELDRRHLTSYPGNYSSYLAQAAERQERLAKAEEDRRRLLRQELAWVQRSPMARGTKQKARKQRLEELQRIRYDSGQDRVALTLASRRLGKKVLAAHGLAKAYGGHVVFAEVDFDLAPGDRVGIVGPNGAGKSTFLDLLAGVQEPDAGRVIWGDTVHLGYYDQRNVALDESLKVIDFVKREAELIHIQERNIPTWNRTAADLHLVDAPQMLEWFLFPRPQQQAYIGALSGGERRRLYLLRTLIHQPNVLLLDEPTNDLDIQTLTVLEEFLDHFRGCLIVASHDRYFLDRTVDFLISFEPGGEVSGRFPGPFEVYRRMREAERAHEGGEITTTHGAQRRRSQERQPDVARETPRRKLSWKEQRELEALEERIEALEEEKQVLQAEVNISGDDYTRLQALAERLAAIDAELDRDTERWLELSELTS